MSSNYYENDKRFNVSFSMINHNEFKLIVNALKRQVDYYRNRVFNQYNVLTTSELNWSKHNLNVYKELYSKILHDNANVVKFNA